MSAKKNKTALPAQYLPPRPEPEAAAEPPSIPIKGGRQPAVSMRARRSTFIAEYLKDFNATQAAIRAGYNPKSAMNQSYRLLHHPETQAMLRSALAKTKNASVLDIQEALEILTAIARGKVGDYIDERGDIDLGKLKRYAGSALCEVVKDYKAGKVGAKFRDPIMAIDRIAKLLGWDAPQQVNVRGEVIVVTPGDERREPEGDDEPGEG